MLEELSLELTNDCCLYTIITVIDSITVPPEPSLGTNNVAILFYFSFIMITKSHF